MAQKFVGLDEAAEQLGVSKESLNDLREAGKLRGYRDGTSWKFRAEDIEKLATEGVPGPDSDASGIHLAPPEELEQEAAVMSAEESAPTAETSDIGLDVPVDEETVSAGASDMSLEALEEPTVPVDLPEEASPEGSDVELDLAEGSDPSDSILLSEVELGESTDRPPSTIIGKADLGLNEELDLIISAEEKKQKSSDSGELKLRSSSSDILSSDIAGSGVLDIDMGDPAEKFEGLAELEVDLEAESSRILSPEDVSKAQKAAGLKKPGESSGFELASIDSDAGLTGISGLDAPEKPKASEAGLTGLSGLELETDDDDEMVLGEGSDVTLSSDSGINLAAPSDSGLDLGEVALDLSASAVMGSGIDLGGVGEDVALAPLGSDKPEKAKGEDFLLTPISEEAEGSTEESSSQIIDVAGLEEEAAAAPIFTAEPTDADMLGGGLIDTGLTPGAYVTPVQESTFSTANVLSLALCIVLLVLCGMMLVDLTRNIWSWDQTYSVNSTLIEGILSLFPE